MFYYLNPGFLDDKGHHLTHQTILYKIYRDEFCVLSNSELKHENLPYKVIKCFSQNTWTYLSNRDKFKKFKLDLLNLVDFVRKDDIFFMYMGDVLFVQPYLEMINAHSLKGHFFINLFHSGSYLSSSKMIQDNVYSLLKSTKYLREQLGVSLMVETEKLQENLTENISEEFPILPMFHSVEFNEVTKESKKNDSKKIITILSASLPRGLKQFVDLVNYIENSNSIFFSKVIFRVRVFQDSNENLKLIDSIKNKVEIYRGTMSDSEFQDFVTSTDVMLLPYLSSSFQANTSGVFSDSIMNGIPVVATENTWSGFHTKRLDIGQVFEEDNVEDFYKALTKVIENINFYKSNVIGAKSEWSKYHCPDNVAAMFKKLTDKKLINTSNQILIKRQLRHSHKIHSKLVKLKLGKNDNTKLFKRIKNRIKTYL